MWVVRSTLWLRTWMWFYFCWCYMSIHPSIHLYSYTHILQAKIWGKAINLSFLSCESDRFMEIVILCYVVLQFFKVLKIYTRNTTLLWRLEKQTVTPEVGWLQKSSSGKQASFHKSSGGAHGVWNAECKCAFVLGCTRELLWSSPWNTIAGLSPRSPDPHFTEESTRGLFLSLRAFLVSYKDQLRVREFCIWNESQCS